MAVVYGADMSAISRPARPIEVVIIAVCGAPVVLAGLFVLGYPLFC